MAEIAENLVENTGTLIKRTREAIIVTIGTVMTDLLAHHAAEVKAGADLGEHALKAIPSVFVAPEVSSDVLGKVYPSVDLAVDVSTVGAGTLLARETTSTKDLVKLALAAQAAAVGTNIAITEGGLLDRAEASQQDVGGSALTTAFVTKYLFDRVQRSESERQRRIRQFIAGAFIGAMTFGAAYIDSKNAATDLGSHSASAAVGLAASYLGNRSRGVSP